MTTHETKTIFIYMDTHACCNKQRYAVRDVWLCCLQPIQRTFFYLNFGMSTFTGVSAVDANIMKSGIVLTIFAAEFHFCLRL